MSALEAARLGDEIGHTSVLAGLLIGAVAAAVIAVAIVAIVGTGGMAAVAIGAGIAAAAAGGALGGAYIGELIPTSPTGAILTGSFDVFIGSLSAARAGLDTAGCSGMIPLFPHATPLIAQGSTNVFINQMMAARRTDKLVCGAAISKGCTTVFVGGGTATVPGLTIESEVPGWLTTTLWVVMIVGTIIATGGAVLAFGWGAAIGALIGGVVGSFLGAEGGAYVGREIGGWFGNAELGARIGSVVGGFLGGLAGGIVGGKAGAKWFPKGGIPVPVDGNPAVNGDGQPVQQGGDPPPPDPQPPPEPEPQPRPLPPPGEPDPATVARTGEPSEVNTNRPSEWPYKNPPEMYRVRPGEPLPPLDPNRKYVWVVDPDGNVLVAPEDQNGWNRPVKHGDLTPGPDGQSRGPARTGGELNYNPETGQWEMNNDSSYVFNRTDGHQGTGDNLQAAYDLLKQSGSDTSNIVPVNSHGGP